MVVQYLIMGVVLLVAAVFLGKRVVRTLRSFFDPKAAVSCGGCPGSRDKTCGAAPADTACPCSGCTGHPSS